MGLFVISSVKRIRGTTMKKLLSTVATIAALGIACSPAMADDPVSKQLSINGEVGDVASMPTEPETSGDPNNSTFDASEGSINITKLAKQNLLPEQTNITIKYPDVVTNYNTKLSLVSSKQGLTNSDVPSPPDNFTNKIDYTAVAKMESNLTAVATLDTSDTDSVTSVDEFEPFSDSILIDISVPGGTSGDKLVEGTYSDTLTLKIGSSL